MILDEILSTPLSNDMNASATLIFQPVGLPEYVADSVSARKDSGGDQTLPSQQCGHQSRADYSGDLITTKENCLFWLSPSAPLVPEDIIDWDQLLEDCNNGIEPQDVPDGAGPALDHNCTCFTVALAAIRQLSDLSEGTRIQQIGRNLEELACAVKLCENFLNCSQSCHQDCILLYIAVLEQVSAHYLSFTKRVNSTGINCKNATIEVVIDGFTFKTGFGSDMGQAILKEKMKRALDCTRSLAQKLQLYVDGGCEAEVEYDQAILSSLANSIGRDLAAVGGSPQSVVEKPSDGAV